MKNSPNSRRSTNGSSFGSVGIAVTLGSHIKTSSTMQTPYSPLFRWFVRPRLAAPAELEDSRPPRFAQAVGLFFTTAALIALLAGAVTAGLVLAAVALVAALLNATTGLRLLDRTGEFTAEVPTSATGQFRFFAAPGAWTLRTLAPSADPVERQVQAEKGSVAEVAVAI